MNTLERLKRLAAPTTRLAALLLATIATGGASAAVKPVAVWNRDFPTTGNSASRGNITLDLNGNTSDGSKITIASGANGGVRLMNSNHPYGGVTALAAMNADSVDFTKQPVFGTGRRYNAKNGATINNDCGTYFTSGKYQHGFHSDITDWGSAGSIAWPGTGLRYAAFHYQTKNYATRGTFAYYTTPTASSTAFSATGLVNGSDDNLYGVTIGGCYNNSDTSLSIEQMTGAEIQFIAVFASKTADSTTTYASSTELQKWSLTDMTSASTPASGDTLSSANNATLVHQGINLPTDGYITIDGDVTVAALFAQGNSEIRFADSNSSLTVNGVVYVAGSNTLTVNASALNGLPGEEESSVTHDALLCSYIAGTIAVTKPVVASGYVVDTMVNATGYKIVIEKGSNYDETITGSKSWSSEKPTDWIDGSVPTIDITVENGTTAEFTFDEAVQAGIATIHCDGNLTLTMGANVTFSSLVIEGSGNVTLAKSGSPTISIGAYDFSACTGAVTLNYVIADPSTVSGAVVLGAAYSNETSIPAFMDGVTIGTAMGSVTAYKNVVPNVTIASGASLTVGGSMNTGSDGTKNGVIGVYKSTGAGNYIVEGNLTAGAWHVQEDNAIASIAVRNGGVADFTSQNAESMLGWSYGTYSYSATGTGSKLAFYTISSRYLTAAIPINISDNATLEIKNSIGVKNGSVAGYNINLSNAKIASSGAWSTSTSGFDVLKLKINLSGANTFDTSTYNVTYSHQIADQNAGTPGSITKTGSGTLTLSAASPAKGTFTVSAGELAFTTGSWAGSVDVTGGTLTVPGTSAVIAGNVTVRSGAILSITTEQSPFMNVCSGTLTLEGGAVVKVNGTTVASPVVVDGSIASSTSCVWGAGTTGEWDTNANWLTGAAPSAQNEVVLRTANATITVSANSTAGDVYVDESTTIAGTAAALASFATKVNSITVASGKTLTLSCTDDGTYTFSKAIDGDGSFAVSGGTVTLSGASTFSGNMIVCADTKAKAGASGYAGDGESGPFGPKVTATSVASATRRVEVLSGGTIDMNGYAEMRYFFKLAGNGIDGNGALINSGSDIGTNKANVSGIELSGDASIGGSGNFGIIAGGYATTVFDLAGYTLSKKGNNTVYIISGSKKANSTKGTLKVEAGVLYVYDGGPTYNKTTDLSDTAVQVAGGTLTVDGAFNIGALTQSGGTVNVNDGKTLTVSSINVAASATMSPSGTIACNGNMTIGGTVTVPSGKSWTVSEVLTVSNGASLTVDGTLTLPKNQSSAFTISTIESGGSVTISSTGYILTSGANGGGKHEIYGTLINNGGRFECVGEIEVHSGGVVSVSGIGSLWAYFGMMYGSAPGNSGTITVPSVNAFKTRVYSSSNAPTKVVNTSTGKVVFKPTDSDIGTASIGAFSDYVVVGDGSVEIDVTNLTLPTGTDKLTLFSTTTALDLTKFSVTGNSDYYLQQNAQDAETNPGAVTLQLHAAKASTGEYYDTLQDMYMGMNLYQKVLTILDGQGATYVATLNEFNYGAVYDDTTKELFLAVAQIGETKYPSLSAAFAAATDGQTVALLKASSEVGVALNDKSITFSENGKAFGGTLTGNGTIIVSAAPSSTTWTSARFAAGWTGTFVMDWTVENQSSGTQWVLDNYGITGSKVQVGNAIEQGYFSTPNNAVPSINPAVFFDSNVSVNNGWDGSTTTFAQIGMASGATFNTRGHGTYRCTYAFTEVKDFAGTVSVNGIDTVAIGTVILDAEPTLGTCILKVAKAANAIVNLQNTKIKVGSGEAESTPIIYSGTMSPTGLYLPAASATTSGSVTTTHASIEEAVVAAGDNGTVTILANVNMVTVNPSQTVVVADGVTVGTISWGAEYATATSVTGDGTTQYTHGSNVATTYYWTGASGSAWSAVGNWAVGAANGSTATRAVTSEDTVVFPSGTHTVALSTNNGTEKCGAMTITGDVTLQRANAGTWAYLQINGDVSGTGTLKLLHVGLGALANRTISCPVVVDGTDSKDALCNSSGKTFTFTNTVTIDGEFKGNESPLTFTGPVILNNGGYVYACGSSYRVDVRFNGGITVAENASSSLTRTSAGYHTIASQVTLSTGSTLTIPVNTTVSGATFTGAGTVSFAELPSLVASNFASTWTGTVVLPAFTGSGQNLNNFGKSGSTVALTGMASGYIAPGGYNVAPNLRLDGAFNITAMSEQAYRFATVSGSGNMSFSTNNETPISITIAEVAPGYSGQINNSTDAKLTVTKVTRASAPSAGDKILSTTTPNAVDVSSVYVGDAQQSVCLEKKSDGIYVAATGHTESVSGVDVTVLTPADGNTSLDVLNISGKIAIPGTVTQISGVTAENLLLKVTYNSGADTAYYAILSLDSSGNVSLNGSATVNGVKVQPELSATAPIGVVGTTPKFKVKTIPGLWYAVKYSNTVNDAGTGLGGTVTAGTAVQATSESTEVVGVLPDSDAIYYKISTGTTQADAQATVTP